MTLELNEGVEMELDSAQLLFRSNATPIISCLAFTLGCSYFVEMTSVIDENYKGQTFGVQVEKLKLPDEQKDDTFYTLLELSGSDFFLRFALLDYVKAINTDLELPFLCFRGIETIKGRFKKQLADDQQKNDDRFAWEAMHSSIGTIREEIDLVKKSADLIRRGNYYGLGPSTEADRIEYLKITKNCILKYKDYLVNA